MFATNTASGRSLRCSNSPLGYGDFDSCFQFNYLQGLLPLITCGVSFLVIVASLTFAHFKSTKDKDYDLIATGISNSDNYDQTSENTSDDSNLSAKRPFKAFINRHGPRLLAASEFAAIGGQIAIHIVSSIRTTWPIGSVLALTTWIYLGLIVSLRIISTTKIINLSFLWHHTAWIYTVQWLLSLIIVRSFVISPRPHYEQTLFILDFLLSTFLVIITLSTPQEPTFETIETDNASKPPPEQHASLLSLATFSWMDSLIWHGYKKHYDLSMIFSLQHNERAKFVIEEYRQVKSTYKLVWSLLDYSKGAYFVQFCWATVTSLVMFVQIFVLRVVLQYLENPQEGKKASTWMWILVLFLSGTTQAVAFGQSLWIGRKIGIKTRAILVGEVYNKILMRNMSITDQKILGDQTDTTKDSATETDKPKDANVSPGAVMNLMSIDATLAAEVSGYLHNLLVETPIQLTVTLCLLYNLLGYSALTGVLVLIIFIPINLWIARQLKALQKTILSFTDGRIEKTNELINNIRIIKYFAWEDRFLAAVDEKRRDELRALRYKFFVYAIAGAFMGTSPLIITAATFIMYTTVAGHELPPSIAFTALSLFGMLKPPLDGLTYLIAWFQTANVSVGRIEELLSGPETLKYKQLTSDEKDETGECLLGFEQATVSWADNSEAFKLIDLDFRFVTGHLNVILGPTGSGKTSVVMALLGEMTNVGGRVFSPDSRSGHDRFERTGLTESIAYCAQDAWILNGTIKDNITFGSDYDASRFEEVLTACFLKPDLAVLKEGVQTLVGDKGITLSGGQKQRVAIARALYSRARHLLLDDVLSAVDSHVARWIFEKALTGSLMENRTCILVTHNESLCLPRARFAVLLENGRVAALGSGAELVKSRTTSSETSSTTNSPVSENGATKEIDQEALEEPKEDDPPALEERADANLPEEKRSLENIGIGTTFAYMRAMGGILYWVFVVTAFVLQQLSYVGSTVWITRWSNAYIPSSDISAFQQQPGLATTFDYMNCMMRSNTFFQHGSCLSNAVDASDMNVLNTSERQVNISYFGGLYLVIIALYMLTTMFKTGIVFTGSLSASVKLHTRMLMSIVYAKFQFFDTTPMGQILNRCSKDMEAIDQEVATDAVMVANTLVHIVTIIVVISAVMPQFLIVAVFITMLCAAVGALYVHASREIKQLDSTQRSPLFQHFGETVAGYITIRAYGAEDRFKEEVIRRLDNHTRPFIYLWGANRWLAFRVALVSTLVTVLTSALLISGLISVNAGAAGLALTYATTFSDRVLWFVRFYAFNEQNMIAVGRVNEYLDLKQEAPAVVADSKLPPSWPQHGTIEFKRFSTKYREELEFVLQDITLQIEAGEKVGVVGRSGAGKSSLALALFRALEADQGEIVIDSIDISTTGLRDLRENVVMVPQDPTLFKGSVRSNLDPFGMFTDEELFSVLRRVQLIGPATDSVPASRPASRPASPGPGTETPELNNRKIFNDLNHNITESGDNISKGQRQLLCLARALLREPKVLLMDEATASIDHDTDAHIQETIRDLGNTIITIAHRLRTIMDYDKVLVLDKGRVVEFGVPAELLKIEGGSFTEMCKKSGEWEVLQKLATKDQGNIDLIVMDEE